MQVHLKWDFDYMYKILSMNILLPECLDEKNPRVFQNIALLE